jgi:hypothetical protein
MNKFYLKLVLLTSLLLCSAAAQEGGHYFPGVFPNRGLSTLPPVPGAFYSQFITNYSSDTLKDRNGDEFKGLFGPRGRGLNVEIDAKVNAFTPFFMFMTDKKILGGDYGAAFALPLVNSNVSGSVSLANRFGRQASFKSYGVGDITIQPLLIGWHGKRWDSWTGYGFYAPTGRYEDGATDNLGLGHFTHFVNVGGGYYFNDKKDFGISALATYELPTNKSGVDITPGQRFTLDWGISKAVSPKVELGITGYSQWQVGNDTGRDVTYNADIHDQIHAVGGEITINIPKGNGLSLSLRHLREFGAVQRFQGHNTTLAISYPIDIWLGDSSPEAAPEAAPQEKSNPSNDAGVAPSEGKARPATSPKSSVSRPQQKEPAQNWFDDVE